MANYRVFIDYENREIYAYINDDNRCFIEINTGDEEYTGFVALDKEDLLDFINELNRVVDSM